MTPQESQLVDGLFDRLAKLENTPRDAAAERLIGAGAQRAPHALYALVQTALLQDEALKRANARIEEMQAELDGAQEGDQEPERPQPSFLDSMREAFGGQRREARGSVPSVRAQNAQSQGDPRQPDYPPQAPPPGNPPGAAIGSGGSFLGTAASAAAGVVGGALLLDGIRSMFGHHPGGAGSSAFGNPSEHHAAHGSDPAHELGIDHIGDHHAHEGGDHAHEGGDHAGKADTDAQNIADDEEQDRNDDDDFDDDDDDNGDDDDDGDDDDNGDGSDDSYDV
jgi:hypothetical protein